MSKNIYRENLFNDYERVIVISDIHCDVDLFEKLLKKVEFSDNDFLIILGDFLRRGKNNIEGLKYFYNNYFNKDNVFIMMGNNESHMIKVIESRDITYLQSEYNIGPNSLVSEIIELKCDGDINEQCSLNVIDYLDKNIAFEYEFLVNLDLSLETEDFIFVHSGISNNCSVENSSKKDLLKNDTFILEGINSTNKWIIVGHIPTFNINEKACYNQVIFNDRKIIGLDGGVNILEYGQLNALIIDKNKEFEFIWEDRFDLIEINTDYTPEILFEPFHTTFPNFEITVLKQGIDFSLVNIVESNKTGYVKNEFIIDNKYCYEGFNNLLTVVKGEKVKLLGTNFGNYILIRKLNGETGFILK